jgi:CrcB protein
LINLLLVFLGAGVGVVVRLGSLQLTGNSIWVLLLINCIACFLAGVISANVVAPKVKMLLITGFLGGMSTLSGVDLIVSEQLSLQLFGYTLLTFLLSLCCCFAGAKVTILGTVTTPSPIGATPSERRGMNEGDI